jgi:hypothetical protein
MLLSQESKCFPHVAEIQSKKKDHGGVGFFFFQEFSYTRRHDSVSVDSNFNIIMTFPINISCLSIAECNSTSLRKKRRDLETVRTQIPL